jgi:hypothetical protein
MKAKLLMSMQTRAVRVPAYELISATDRQYKKRGLKTGFFGGHPQHSVLQVDTFAAERYSPHQIKRHNSKVQAPAPKGTSRLVKGLSHNAPKRFYLSAHPHTHGHGNAM